MYDLKCNECGRVVIDSWESIEAPRMPCSPAVQHPDNRCQGILERVWLAKPPSVIGDECDVWVKHGICNEDGTPKHYRFKSEMRAAAKKKGLVNHVEHIPSPESDKSRHTSRWV